MKDGLAEVAVIVVGLVLLSVGLSVWFGWYVAATVVGGLLVGAGCWSAASAATESRRG